MNMRSRPAGTQFLSTAEAAQILGVGPTSVKRWADLGLLKCVRTAGNHRRFVREDIERFGRSVQSGAAMGPPSSEGLQPEERRERVQAWADRLVSGIGLYTLHGALLAERELCGSWWRLADLIGEAITEIGARWACGAVTVMQEHLASERTARALARCSEALPLPPDPPQCLVATAVGDDHTLGLSLLELALREAGVQVQWVGRASPPEQLARHLQEHPTALVALSASAYSTDPMLLRHETLPLARTCEAVGTPLLLGGSGAWPEDLPGALRLRSFADLHEHLAPLRAAS